MSMLLLRPQTRALLAAAGWSDCYIVDIQPYIDAIDDFQVFPVAQDFLQRFGGIRIDDGSSTGGSPRFHIFVDPIEAIRRTPRWELAMAEEKLERPLYPIAALENGHRVALVDEAGQLFILDGQILFTGPYVLTDIFEIAACDWRLWPLERLFDIFE